MKKLIVVSLGMLGLASGMVGCSGPASTDGGDSAAAKQSETAVATSSEASSAATESEKAAEASREESSATTKSETSAEASSKELPGVEQLETSVMKHEKLIESCMKDKGYPYVAELPEDVYEEVARYKAEREGKKFDPTTVEAPKRQNDIYLETLSAEQDKAWSNAYMAFNESDEDPGCYKTTFEEAWGYSPDLQHEKIQILEKAIAEHPQLKIEMDKYKACMLEAGFEVENTNTIHEIFGRRSDEIAKKNNVEMDSEDLAHTPEYPQFDKERREASELSDKCALEYHASLEMFIWEFNAKWAAEHEQ